MAKKKNGRGPLRLLGRIISSSLFLLIILVATWLIITFIGQKTIVSGSSMENTLSDGDQIIVDKISYRFDRPNRYDIVVFPYPHNKSKLYIKRIIGMPGETVQIGNDGIVLINGEPLNESYGREVIASAGIAEYPVTLSDDEYFVLGDNRNDSQDSRDSMVGNIKKEEFVGKAWARIWPLDRMGKLRHQ
ncbi:signal peptidase I [bacterium C-53]|nr:signal peptidase I [Lachnospiraceae bacterium]NBI01974.1 signal peptidase I [Lachnospiraceae bacterium]RKJ12371.1 signal peptidase I [bacterium C-53]